MILIKSTEKDVTRKTRENDVNNKRRPMQVPICLFCFLPKKQQKKRVMLAGCKDARLLFNCCTFGHVSVFLLLDYTSLRQEKPFLYLVLHTKTTQASWRGAEEEMQKKKKVHLSLVDFWHCFLVLLSVVGELRSIHEWLKRLQYSKNIECGANTKLMAQGRSLLRVPPKMRCCCIFLSTLLSVVFIDGRSITRAICIN